jgi:type VI secretion system protein ImpG
VFNKYFQDELAYLRELGREFAGAYPALAPMLADRGGDPDVERLLEGIAFLTGRIRQKLDDEIPEVIHGIAGLLFPHLLSPLPAATIMEISPLRGALRERTLVAAGAEFASIDVDGTQCRFRSAWACELVPWGIEDVRFELLPRGRQQLRITFRVNPGVQLASIVPDKTRLHLAADTRSSLALLMWIHEHLEDVVLIDEKVTGKKREISLGKRVITHAGFEEEDALLPFARVAFPGFRLLEEYYVLPQKFAFIDVKGLGRAEELGKEIGTFVLALRFDAPFLDAPKETAELVKLHCVPVVNIFETSAEPIRLSVGRERFLVRPAGLPPGHAEVYSIQNVETIPRGSTSRIEIPNFYAFSHADSHSEPTRTFYSSHLEPSVVGVGVDMFLSFGTAEDAGALPDADVISVDMLATNGKLAGALRAGEICVPTASSPAASTFRNLMAVTPHVSPPIGRELHWRVVAHAAMGMRSLTELEVLRAVLDVYNLHALVDRQVARANELRVAAIQDIRVTPAERLYRGSLVRGVAIEVDLDESGFAGDGDMYLFSAVLERLYASYVSLNSFSRITVTGVGSKIRFAWPPRSGNQTLL